MDRANECFSNESCSGRRCESASRFRNATGPTYSLTDPGRAFSNLRFQAIQILRSRCDPVLHQTLNLSIEETCRRMAYGDSEGAKLITEISNSAPDFSPSKQAIRKRGQATSKSATRLREPSFMKGVHQHFGLHSASLHVMRKPFSESADLVSR